MQEIYKTVSELTGNILESMINICKKYKTHIGTYEWKYREIPEMYRKIQEMYTTIIDGMER
jgi:hypothetical protein